MNPEETAQELSDLGKSDFRLLSRLEAIHTALEVNRKRRCDLLSELAGAVPMDDTVRSTVIEPKDDGKGGKGG